MITIYLIYVFIFYIILSVIPGQCVVNDPVCCDVCLCTFDSKLNGTRVACRSKGLASIPSDIPFNTVELDLSNNSLVIIRNHSFTGLVLLRYLNLHMNKIILLEESAFIGLNNLLVLRLNQNILLMNYMSYPEMVFVPLSKLQELYIEDNFDKTEGDYAGKIFKPLRELRVLQMDTFWNPTFGEGFTHLTNLRVLRIGGTVIRCTMRVLRNYTLRAFHTAPLEELYMPFCLLNVLEAGSFQFFSNLSILIIRENKVGVKNALRSLTYFKGRNMTEINISRVRFNSHVTDIKRYEDSILTRYALHYLAEICVSKIDLSRNRLTFIDFKTLVDTQFPFGKCIQYIDISLNRLDQNPLVEIIFFHYFSNLTFFNSSQQFERYDGVHQIPRALTLLDIDNTDSVSNDSNITPLPDIWNNPRHEIEVFIILPPKLQYLYLSNVGHNVGKITQNTTVTGLMLRELDISYNGMTKFTATIEGLGYLKKLDLSGNDGTEISENWFDTFPNLQELFLNDMSLQNDFLFWHGTRLFKPLIKLKSVYLAHNNLAVLPQDLFVNNINLEKLDLSFNRLQTLPLQIISLNMLTSISVTFNSISYLNKEVRKALDIKIEPNTIRIYLKGNIFACGCESLDLITWLMETEIVLDNKGNYSCISEHGSITTTSLMISSMDLFWRTCHGKLWLFFSICGLTLLLATFLSFMLISRLKTRIIHWIFNILGRDIDFPKRTNFDYDLFVVHADSEYQWPCHTMIQNLEEHPERRIRLCLKERNILPGVSNAESIVECIYSSWKSVIILTQAFVEDEWCIFAMRTAIYSISNLTPNRVIVLWEKDMTVQQVPEDLLSVLDERSIIQFSWQVDSKDRFWQDLYTLIVD